MEANNNRSENYSFFSVGAITEISGCEDEECPEEFLNVNIKLEDGITVRLRVLY